MCYFTSNADITDTQIAMTQLDPTLFPGVNPAVEVHSGFASVQVKCVILSSPIKKKKIRAHDGHSTDQQKRS